MEVTVYTDASRDAKLNIATCGYCVIIDGKLVKHTVHFAENVMNSGIAEGLAAALALQHAFLLTGVVNIKKL